MESKSYTWETTFETTEETMTHVFSDRVKVICDFRFGIITTLRDGYPVDKFSFMEKETTIDDYEQFLLGIARTAEQPKQFDYE